MRTRAQQQLMLRHDVMLSVLPFTADICFTRDMPLLLLPPEALPLLFVIFIHRAIQRFALPVLSADASVDMSCRACLILSPDI